MGKADKHFNKVHLYNVIAYGYVWPQKMFVSDSYDNLLVSTTTNYTYQIRKKQAFICLLTFFAL